MSNSSLYLLTLLLSFTSCILSDTKLHIPLGLALNFLSGTAFHCTLNGYMLFYMSKYISVYDVVYLNTIGCCLGNGTLNGPSKQRRVYVCGNLWLVQLWWTDHSRVVKTVDAVVGGGFACETRKSTFVADIHHMKVTLHRGNYWPDLPEAFSMFD